MKYFLWYNVKSDKFRIYNNNFQNYFFIDLIILVGMLVISLGDELMGYKNR